MILLYRFRLIKRSLQPRTSLEEQEEEEKQEVDPEVQQLASEQSLWLLQNQTRGKDWQDCYQFTTFQCFDPDYQASNKATSDRNAAPFATMILVVRYVLDPILIDESKRWVERDGLDKHLYPYHPNLVQQRMVVGDKYIVKKGEEEVEVRQIQSESERVELLKKQFGLLKHVETNEAVEEIRGKPSALNNKCEKEGNKSGSQRNPEW
ncbi:uncharacterized protein UDID_17060 [Ustilago sp. UG-2017a]|nr:uncharacterized protein UDID_17060 [Ustilago sp. UG-2017a]